ncbi:hypothetical protein EIP91_001503 [Steccherinum ochraceum]|uniref:Uncharacterized protein n=1 Tax=Steccherinum ochraceum TaxID=92696 RepID=A0A4R0RTR5_9APHY|nr:hypothetical protein EIP91_001503 [Steccherinum ochraceum]
MWTPKRSLAECDTILTAPGMPWEVETRIVHGRMIRVYKNNDPTLRDFWIKYATLYKDKECMVYEDRRWSFNDVFQSSLQVASIFTEVYGVKKGDRIAICARNLPEYIFAFWACHLVGAISVLVNAWLPLDPLVHCLNKTENKLIFVDAERAQRLAPSVAALKRSGVSSVVVLDRPVSKWEGITAWPEFFKQHRGDATKILRPDFDLGPDDDASIFFTSGTTGLPKGVLSTHRAFLTNLPNVTYALARAKLRTGQNLPGPDNGPQRGILLSVPLFHVTGGNATVLMSAAYGAKMIIMRKWDTDEAMKLIQAENIQTAGGVPAMVTDMINSPMKSLNIENVMFGGATPPEQLPARVRAVFPNAVLTQAYGLTETNSTAISVGGEDYDARPLSTGLPCPVVEVIAVRDNKEVPRGETGELWLRGPDIMRGYWRDPEASNKALTLDGWFKSGDLGYIDQEGFVFIRDRIKDLIIRGGENIDSTTVENAIYNDTRIYAAAAVGVPDPRLGELVAAVVSVKPEFHGKVKESEILEITRKTLPKFAVPVVVVVQDTTFAMTPSGKIMKAPLRALAKAEWERRKTSSSPASRL